MMRKKRRFWTNRDHSDRFQDMSTKEFVWLFLDTFWLCFGFVLLVRALPAVFRSPQSFLFLFPFRLHTLQTSFQLSWLAFVPIVVPARFFFLYCEFSGTKFESDRQLFPRCFREALCRQHQPCDLRMKDCRLFTGSLSGTEKIPLEK